MPRIARQVSASGIYHVVQRGNDKQVIFDDDDDRRRYLGLLKETTDKFAVRLIAWCLMDNHVHLLVDDSHDSLSDAIHRLATRYAMAFNGRWGRTGHVFQGRFGSQAVEDEGYLLEAFRYIHNNPALAGMAPANTYPWSSYGEYAYGRGVAGLLCDTSLLSDSFGDAEGIDAFLAQRAPVRYYYEGGMSLSDEQARRVASYILGDKDPATRKQMKPIMRRPYVRAMVDAGISLRQIARITGLSRTSLVR